MIRRGSDWAGGPSAADLTAIGNSTPDGFTGHEMLDGVGLIHMSGRVYDPTVGRFLSVDPIVRDAAASQSWNGYGYVEGRLLSATDPSGYQAKCVGGNKTTVDCNPVSPDPWFTERMLSRNSYHAIGAHWVNDHAPTWGTSGPAGAVVNALRPSWVSTGVTSWTFVDQGSGGNRGDMRDLPSRTVSENPKVTPQGEPCTSDGTVTGFLEQHGAEVVDRTLSVVGGAGQMVLGATICSGGATCAGGAVLAAHGASNIYEGVTGTTSVLRDGYHAVLGSAGDVAYSLVNIGTSMYGLTRPVVSPGTWRLFRNISSDYVPAFRTMTGTELVTDGAGIINDGLRAAGVPSHSCKGP